jgi:superfamily II DNA/RNA helicase
MSDVRYIVLDEADTLLCDNFVDDIKALMAPLRVSVRIGQMAACVPRPHPNPPPPPGV